MSLLRSRHVLQPIVVSEQHGRFEQVRVSQEHPAQSRRLAQCMPSFADLRLLRRSGPSEESAHRRGRDRSRRIFGPCALSRASNPDPAAREKWADELAAVTSVESDSLHRFQRIAARRTAFFELLLHLLEVLFHSSSRLLQLLVVECTRRSAARACWGSDVRHRGERNPHRSVARQQLLDERPHIVRQLVERCRIVADDLARIRRHAGR